MQRLKLPRELSTTRGGGESPAEFGRNASSEGDVEEGFQKWPKKPNRGELNAKRIASPSPPPAPAADAARAAA